MSEQSSFSYKEFAAHLGFQVFFTVITHPIDFAEFLMQIGHAPIPGYPKRTMFGLRNTLKYVGHIKSEDGFLGCYRGLMSKIRAKLVSSTVNLAVSLNIRSSREPNYEEEDGYNRDKFLHFCTSLLKDLAEKSTAIVASQPFYVISWRVMGQFVGREQIYRGFFGSIGEIYRREGVTGFFTGLIPRWLAEAMAYILSESVSFILNSFLINDTLLRVATKALIKYICYGLTYPFTVAAVCYGVSDCGLTCGQPPNMPRFEGWWDALNHLHETGRLYSKVPNTSTKSDKGK